MNNRRIKIGRGSIVAGVLLLLASCVAGLLLYRAATQNPSVSPNAAVTTLPAVSPEELNRKIAAGESFFVFVGRHSCTACQQLKPRVLETVAQLSLAEQVYYLDTESATEAVHQFADQYQVTTVPRILYFANADKQAELVPQKRAVTPQELHAFFTHQ